MVVTWSLSHDLIKTGVEKGITLSWQEPDDQSLVWNLFVLQIHNFKADLKAFKEQLVLLPWFMLMLKFMAILQMVIWVFFTFVLFVSKVCSYQTKMVMPECSVLSLVWIQYRNVRVDFLLYLCHTETLDLGFSFGCKHVYAFTEAIMIKQTAILTS